MLKIQKNLSNVFFVILGLPSTAMGFALSIQIAVLSWILHTRYNLEIHQIGIVWAAGPIAGILGQPIIGLISEWCCSGLGPKHKSAKDFRDTLQAGLLPRGNPVHFTPKDDAWLLSQA